MNVGDWARKRALISKDKVGIVYEDRYVTFYDFNREVNRLSHAFLRKGIKRGDVVCAILRNSDVFLEIYFALSKIGAIFSPLNFRLAPFEFLYLISDCRPKILIFEEDVKEAVLEIKPKLEKEIQFIYVGEDPPIFATSYMDFKSENDSEPDIESPPLSSPQMIMYTSGTTGLPKGAVLSHRKTFYNTFNACLFWDISEDDTMLVVLPLFHSGGLNICAIPAFYVGAKIVIKRHFEPLDFLRTLQEFNVTHTMVVPTMLNMILKKANFSDFNLSLKTLLIAGEPCPPRLIEDLLNMGIPVRQAFGQTETSIMLCQPKGTEKDHIGSVGVSVFHAEVKVVNEKGVQVKPGEIGEVVVKGPILMDGYLNKEEETRRTIRDGWLFSGDMATVDKDGHIYVVDRKKDMFISGGENVYPAEIERVLIEYPSILEVCVVGVPDATWGEVGLCVIVPKEGVCVSELKDGIKKFCEKRLAKFKVPKRWAILDELPKTTSGKIKRVDIKKMYEEGKIKEI